MKSSQKLLELFPIKNTKWCELIRAYLEDQQEDVCKQILSHIEPCLNKLLPDPNRVFEALNYTDPQRVQAVIIGQDPYPTPGDAHGLCFSVEHGKPPASLKNIFKEIQHDFGGELRTNANLLDWAKQGVLLLNSSLTVLPKNANCHSKIGWQTITSFIAKTAWTQSPHSVFLLWGNNAKKLIQPLPDSPRILTAGHPSPLAYGKKKAGNFKGCNHFKKANQLLLANGLVPIIWHERDTLLDFIIQ